MHKFLPSFVIVIVILLMLSLSAVNTFAEQQSIRLVLSSNSSGNGTTSARIKRGGSATVVTPTKSASRIVRTARARRAIPTPTKTPTPTRAESGQAKKPVQTTSRVTPTKTPTPTPTTVTEQPTTETPAAGGGEVALSDEQKFMLQAINDYRVSKGLSGVKADKYTCEFAATRAQEIKESFNHDGFRSRIDNKSLPYPSYSLVTENIARTSEYTKVVQMWIESESHAENMRKDSPYVCVAKQGDFYAFEGWRP